MNPRHLPRSSDFYSPYRNSIAFAFDTSSFKNSDSLDSNSQQSKRFGAPAPQPPSVHSSV